MNVYYNLNDVPAFQNSVVTIGSFDGIHTGHQKILEQVNHLAKQAGGESIVVTFHPHPRLIIYPKDKSLQLITTIDEKIDLLKKYGIQNVVIVPFTVEFSQQSPDEYIEKFLYEKFHPAQIVIGYDHHFGLNRQGNIDYLKEAGKRLNFGVVEIQKQEVNDIAISSTKIRTAILEGAITKANTLLGHPFRLTGKVIQGQRIGHTIGFPTANIEIKATHKIIPAYGIYAVFVFVNYEQYKGMLYIGERPSMPHLNHRTIEVNIFDFKADIYGREIKIDVIDFIRADEKYANLDELQHALKLDKKKSLQRLN